jgi:hypothetical protein
MIAERPANSTTKTLVFLISIAIGAMIPVIAIAAETLPIDVHVFPGEKLVIRFQFKRPPIAPEGPADILVINGGGGDIGFIATRVSLYVGKELIGSYTNPQGNAFSIFTDPSSVYTGRLNPADLSALFSDGRVAVVEYQPIFDPNSVGAFIDYNFNFFYAARGVSSDVFVEAFPAPVLLSVQVRPVTEELCLP